RRTVPLAPSLVFVALLTTAQGIKGQFRDQTIKARQTEFTGRVSLFATLMEGSVRGGQSRLREAGEKAGSRADHLSDFAHVIARTGTSVPYWGGETYMTLFTSLIPRVLYPNKPKKKLGQEYGHRYRFIAPSDHGTSINFEQIVEMYANFGAEGVCIGMFL